MPDSEFVHTVKKLIQNETRCPAEDQILKGWPFERQYKEAVMDHWRLAGLHLPQKTSLQLKTLCFHGMGIPSGGEEIPNK